MSSEITITSTSPQSAEAEDPIVLRETQSTRLVFWPAIVQNNSDPSAAVRGHIVYQRKTAVGEWEDWHDVKLNQLKAGEGVQIELKAEETRALFDGLTKFYQLHQQHGVPVGTVKFVDAAALSSHFTSLSDDQLDEVMQADSALGKEMLSKLLAWGAEHGPVNLGSALEALSKTDLSKLSVLVGATALKKALSVWEEYLADPSNNDLKKEEHWQDIFGRNTFVLAQMFPSPVVIAEEKAYVGGKKVSGKGSAHLDFLAKHSATENAVFIEIKTPDTKLLGTQYRTGVYNVSRELSGSVLQVLNYRMTYAQHYAVLQQDNETKLPRPILPPCCVVIGRTSELDEQDKAKAFELYRNSLAGVTVLTYDEVFGRVQALLDLLEARE